MKSRGDMDDDNIYAPTGDWASNPERNCAGLPVGMFFLENGESGGRVTRLREVCADCPVFKDCREYSMSIPGLSGFWAGMTGKERRLARKAEGYSVSRMVREKPRAACGTPSGYNRHRDLNEDVCPSCREARNAYERERKEKALRLVKA